MSQTTMIFKPTDSVSGDQGSLMDVCTALAAALKSFLNLDYDLDIINPQSDLKSVYIIGLPDIDGNKTRYGLYFRTSAATASVVDTWGNPSYNVGYGVLRPDGSFDYTSRTCVPYTLAGASGSTSNSITSTISFYSSYSFVFFATTNELMQARGLCFLYASSDEYAQQYLTATVASCWNTIIKCASVATGDTDHVLLYYPSGSSANQMLMLSPNGQDIYYPPSIYLTKNNFFTISKPYVSGYTINNLYVAGFYNSVINDYFNTFSTITDECFYDGITINNIHYKGSWAYSQYGVRFFIPDNS